MPPFTLALWELPPDCTAPLTAPADFVFRSLWQCGVARTPRETEIWLRVVPHEGNFLQFFCDGERPQNGNWVLSNVDSHFPLSDSRWDVDTLEELFRTNDDLWYEFVMRVIFFNGAPYGVPGPHRATFVPGSPSCQLSAGNLTLWGEGCQITRFDFPFKNYRLPPRAVTTRNQLLAALKYPESKAHQALLSLHLPLQEQRAQEQEFVQKKLDPMKAVLTAVLQSQTNIWEVGLHLHWSTRELRRQALALYGGRGWNGNDLYTIADRT